MTASSTVFITGGGRRVGAALARHFAQEGYDIALHYHTSESGARELQGEIQAQGRACRLFPHDLSDIAGLAGLMRRVVAAMPNCNVLINNASVFDRAEFAETTEVFFDRQFAINFKAPFFLTQAFAGIIGKGAVLNFVDSDITTTEDSHFAYLLSKKVLTDFTRMAARTLGPDIRVNAVCPGILLPTAEDEHYMSGLVPKLPLGRIGTLGEIVTAAHMLCEHPGITGQVVFIDGGKHLL